MTVSRSPGGDNTFQKVLKSDTFPRKAAAQCHKQSHYQKGHKFHIH